MRRPRALSLLALSFALAAALTGAVASCVSGSTFPATSSSGAGGHINQTGIGGEWNPAGGTGGINAGVGGDATWDGLPWPGGDCADPVLYVYLVSTDRVIWRFWPPTLELTKVGLLHCKDPDVIEGPFSMAVDRHGTAWIVYRSGVLHELDLESGHCSESAYVPPSSNADFSVFGMAFTADPQASDEETLYVRDGRTYDPGSEPATRTLGRFDMKSATIVPLAQNPGGNADLSGTGDGKLYAFRKQPITGSAEIAEIDPKTGENLSLTSLGDLTIGNAWAVAAWGGDIWMFTNEAEASTKIIRYRPATGAIDVMKTDIGPTIIGAGVSSCVPFVPPT
jgi:hypothetical protein